MPRVSPLLRVLWRAGVTSERAFDHVDLLEQAACWHERMINATVTSSDRAGFEQWYSADPANADAYAQMEQAYADVRRLADAPSMVVLRHETLTRIVVPRHRGPWQLAIAASVAILVGVSALSAWQFGPFDYHPAKQAAAVPAPGFYQTAVGERLTVTLSDGSIAALNTASRLRVVYTAERRFLVLEAGQALFEVAKGQTRPFIVLAGDRTVTAHGTAFDVRVERRRVEVVLLEGEVTVAREHADSADRVTWMRPNDVLVASGAATSVKKVEDAKQLASWRDGLIVFENERLDDAIAEVNRYVTRRILLADPSLSDVRISGAFRTGETNSFVEALELGFSIRVVEETPEHVVLVSES